MDRGWALYSYARSNDGWEQFGGLKRSSRGYIGQEVDDLMAIAKEQFNKERLNGGN